MDKKVKEVLLIIKNVHESGAFTFPLKQVETILTEKYGFDLSRNVRPKITYLLDRGVLKPVNVKAGIYRIDLEVLGEVLGDPGLIAEGRERREAERERDKAAVS